MPLIKENYKTLTKNTIKMNKKIWLSPPHMGGSEILYVKNACDANWVAPIGPCIDGFEDDLSRFLGGSVGVAALSAGTAAIHMALIVLGVKAGDEVICQSLTFAASANPIVYQGAIPVFVDSEEQTWNMSPHLLEEAIKDRISKGKTPKAIVVVHLFGMPGRMSEIVEISKKYEIPLIEDAAEALGSTYGSKKLGTFGDIGILSFNGNKIITTSAGGALIAENSELVTRARFLATQAKENLPYYQHNNIGYNYRMSNICAGIGRGQMEILSLRIFQRRRNFYNYKRLLSSIPGISFQEEMSPDYFSNRWLTTILIEPTKDDLNNENLRLFLEKSNIEARRIWKPLHLQPVFEQYPAYVNGISERIFDKGLCLPSGSSLTDYELNKVVKRIATFFDV
jgi:dTDP-4-amino-4,6-dideoxygalactose transaminase